MVRHPSLASSAEPPAARLLYRRSTAIPEHLPFASLWRATCLRRRAAAGSADWRFALQAGEMPPPVGKAGVSCRLEGGLNTQPRPPGRRRAASRSPYRADGRNETSGDFSLGRSQSLHCTPRAARRARHPIRGRRYRSCRRRCSAVPGPPRPAATSQQVASVAWARLLPNSAVARAPLG